MVLAALIAGGLYYRFASAKQRLTDKDTIVLADFDNKTGDAVFDDTLKTALSVSLEQSPFLNVLSESKVAADLAIDDPCRRTRSSRPRWHASFASGRAARLTLRESIASLGSEYVIGLKAVNCQSGDTLAQEQVTAACKEKVLDALGEAASKLRG